MTQPANNVAILGTGTMGAPIARNLLRTGYDVRVWNRTPAKAQTFIILASGAASVRAQVAPIFDCLGRETVWLDRPGDGSRLKVALNNWLAVLVEGMAETIALAETLGLNPRLFLNAVADGPMASEYAIAKGEAMLNSDFVPGFPLRHAAKDAELALSAARSHGIQLSLTSALPRWYTAIANGHGADDVAARSPPRRRTRGHRSATRLPVPHDAVGWC